jgi:hypothetical protein
MANQIYRNAPFTRSYRTTMMADDAVNSDRQEAPGFALVTYAQSELTADNQHLLIQATTVGQGCVRLALRLSDVRHFVTLMLQVVSQADQPPEPDGPASGSAALRQPIPLSAVEIGEFDDGAGFLTLTVGPTPLTFEGPAISISRLGGVLRVAGAATDQRH